MNFIKNLLWLVVFIPAVAFGYSGSFYPETNTFNALPDYNMPIREVYTDSTSISVYYKIEAVNLEDDDLYEGTSWLKINGFGLSYSIENPSLPFRCDKITLPPNKEFESISIIKARYIEQSIELTPARPLQGDDEYIPYTKSNVPPIKYSKFKTPSNIITSNLTSKMGQQVVNVNIEPVQYDNDLHKIVLFWEFEYKINFKDIEPSFTSNSEPDVASSSIYAGNDIEPLAWWDDDTPQPSIKYGCDGKYSSANYLIISSMPYVEVCEELASLKNILGYPTSLCIKNGWTSAEVKDSISHYAQILPNLKYVLIIGGNSDVPAQQIFRNTKYNNPYVSDFYYSCLDGENDLTPDLYIGRIPVNSVKEANVILDKLYNYQLSPITDESFYRNGVNCAYFQLLNESNSSTTEERRFVHTSEEVRDYLTQFGKNIERIYAAPSGTTPTYWNNIAYGTGGLIPAELRDPSFNWGGNASNIVSSINAGCFYILHRDHGGIDCWGSPYFSISHLLQLNNQSKLPVVFSMNCLTGSFNKTNFAEEFLKLEGGGAISVFAATEVTYSGLNDAMVHGMFTAPWPNPGLYPAINAWSTPNQPASPKSPQYSLGEILHAGIDRMEELYGINSINVTTNKERFHILGDPSLMLPTETPTEITEKDFSFSIENGIGSSHSGWTPDVKIQIHSDTELYLSIYDPSRNWVTRYSGKQFNFRRYLSRDAVITLYGPGKIPYSITPNLPSLPLLKSGISIEYNQQTKVCTIKTEQETHYPEVIAKLYDLQSNLIKATDFHLFHNTVDWYLGDLDRGGPFVVALYANDSLIGSSLLRISVF